MPKGDNAVQGIKDHWRIDHLVVVQLSKVLDLRNTSLVELEIILLQAKGNPFENIINNLDDEVLMVAVQSTGEDSQKMDVTVFNLARLAEYPLEDFDNLDGQLFALAERSVWIYLRRIPPNAIS